MFPISNADFFCEEKTGFWSYRGHKTAAAILLDFGKGGFGCNGRDEAKALQF